MLDGGVYRPGIFKTTPSILWFDASDLVKRENRMCEREGTDDGCAVS